jgi:hypothetical protein
MVLSPLAIFPYEYTLFAILQLLKKCSGLIKCDITQCGEQDFSVLIRYFGLFGTWDSFIHIIQYIPQNLCFICACILDVP